MLDDDQLEFFAGATTDIFQRLENTIIADIARRVRKSERWTETAELQAEALRELGWSPYKIRLEVIRRLNANEEYQRFIDRNTLEHKLLQQEAVAAAIAELKERCPEIFEGVGNMSFRNDLSLWAEAGKTLIRGASVDRLVRDMTKRAEGDLINLTKSLGFKTSLGAIIPERRAYTQAMNTAMTQVVTGAMSPREACTHAVRELARRGLRHVDFESGVTRQLDTAAMNAIRTSSAQLSGEIMQANIEENGVEFVQVSEHWGARPSHATWQGGIYHVEQFKAICGYGDPGNPDHIYSYNCRHHHYPFWPGISEKISYPPEPGPFKIGDKTYTYYQVTQKQRAMERDIRALKREALAEQAAGNEHAVSIVAQKLDNKTSQYVWFSNKAGIRPKTERLTVEGFDRSTSSWVSAKAQSRKAMLSAFQSKMENAGFTLRGFSRYYGDQETLDHMSAALERMSALYPDEAKGTIIRWGYSRIKDDYGWYNPDSGIITFNRNAMGNWQAVKAGYDQKVREHFFAAGTNADSIFIHEFGHRVWYARGGGSLNPAVKEVIAKMNYGHISRKQREALIPSLLSEYAAKETTPAFQEVLAESFSEYYNSSSPRDFCKMLLREVGLVSW